MMETKTNNLFPQALTTLKFRLKVAFAIFAAMNHDLADQVVDRNNGKYQKNI